MKKRKWMILHFCILLGMCGCSSNGAGTLPGGNKRPDVKDIAWKVEEGIQEGERQVVFSYVNHSDYIITGITLTFVEKEGISEQEKQDYALDLQEAYDFSEDETKELQQRQITMHTESEDIVEPQQSSARARLYYYSGYYYMNTIEHYELVEPDIMTIRYIDEEKIHTLYYDFKSQRYSQEEESEQAFEWGDSKLANLLPKPDAAVVEKGTDEDTMFSFEAYGITAQEYDTYKEACKEMGFTKDASSWEGNYDADDENGYSLSVTYDEDEHSMSVRITAAED